jgi:hypothetical protein
MTFYLLSLFLRRVLNFSVVGQTNFNIDNATYTLASGANGSFNLGVGFQFNFSPNGYTAQVSDIGRILVVRSNSNPLQNSGLFRITGINTSNNSWVLNYRSGDSPPVETGLQWSLHPKDDLTWSSGGNGAASPAYLGRTSATCSRIILQSPHVSGWQVRITYEPSITGTTAVKTQLTFAPGIGGDSVGDFPVAGSHLHGPLFFNSESRNYTGLVVGLNPSLANGQVRYYIWGDDQTGSVVIITRQVDSAANCTGWSLFGMPEDEEYSSDITIRRLFVLGCDVIANSGPSILGWGTGPQQVIGFSGIAFGYSGQPISCATSTYCRLAGQSVASNGPRYHVNASDGVFIAQTELQTVDLIAGTWDHGEFGSLSQAQVFVLEPRRLGRVPIARLGRSNFGDWVTSTDSTRTWLHVGTGIFMPWMGSILP